ncbi:MAG TPA: ROK family transcriptional regulator [Jiangellaceae bacterium]
MSNVADQVSLRRYNLGTVLRHLRDSGPRSRARIATETGLNKATVSSLVAELEERGLVREGDIERGQVGRPGQAVEIDGRVCGLGVELGIDHIATHVLDLRGETLASRRIAVGVHELGPEPTLGRLATLIEEITVEVAAAGRGIVGVAVGVPGLVETAHGTLRVATNLGWRDINVINELMSLLQGPAYSILLDNDANLAAIAEHAMGAGTGARTMVYVTGEVGVGGGVIVNGQVMRGAEGYAGEVGHMVVAPDGLLCGCGRRGCWETVAGLPAMLRQVADPEDPISDPTLDLEQRLAEIARRAELGDARTLRGLDAVGAGVGLGVSILANVFNPQVIVLGGFFAVLSEYLVPGIENELASRMVARSLSGCRVEHSAYPFGAAARGGAHVVLEAVLADPTSVLPTAHAGGAQ